MKKNTSLTREHNGYVSVKVKETAPIPYKGRYGKGHKTYSHNPSSTRYCFVNYYIAE